MEIKINDDRLIQEYIRIQTKSAKYGVEAVARFLVDKMKTCDICIFQSDFGFLTSDVPFAVMIEKDKSSPYYSCDFYKIKFIDADWQFYPILGRIPPLLSEAKVGDECRLFFFY